MQTKLLLHDVALSAEGTEAARKIRHAISLMSEGMYSNAAQILDDVRHDISDSDGHIDMTLKAAEAYELGGNYLKATMRYIDAEDMNSAKRTAMAAVDTAPLAGVEDFVFKSLRVSLSMFAHSAEDSMNQNMAILSINETWTKFVIAIENMMDGFSRILVRN